MILVGEIENSAQTEIWAPAHFLFHSPLSIVCRINLLKVFLVAQANSDFHAP